MASNWKYATLPAEKRLEMIRQGDEEVFREEKARTLSAIKEREKLGVDSSEQMAWADRLGYNNALYQAKGLGIDESKVEKTGYAQSWLSGNSAKDAKEAAGLTPNTESNGEKLIKEQKKIKDELLDKELSENEAALEKQTENDKRRAYNEAMDKLPSMAEKFANLGLSAEGGTVRTHELYFNDKLDGALRELDAVLSDKKADLRSENAKEKLKNLEEMLAAIKSEREKAENTAYERAKDAKDREKEEKELELSKEKAESDKAIRESELAYAKEKDEADRELQKQELSLAVEKYLSEKKQSEDELSEKQKEREKQDDKDEYEQKLKLLNIILGSVDSDDSGSYLSLLKKYAAEELDDLEFGKNDILDLTEDEVPKSLTRKEIEQALFVMNHMPMNDSVKKDYFRRSGLGNYMSYEQALTGRYLA